MDAALSILVIDDEFDMTALLAELLSARGHRVTTAINGSLGKSLLMSHDFDLVITDFMMPIIDGIQLVQCMRADDRLAGVPVIMISAQRDVMAALSQGLVQAMLQKPFSPRALFGVIDEVMTATAADGQAS